MRAGQPAHRESAVAGPPRQGNTRVSKITSLAGDGFGNGRLQRLRYIRVALGKPWRPRVRIDRRPVRASQTATTTDRHGKAPEERRGRGHPACALDHSERADASGSSVCCDCPGTRSERRDILWQGIVETRDHRRYLVSRSRQRRRRPNNSTGRRRQQFSPRHLNASSLARSGPLLRVQIAGSLIAPAHVFARLPRPIGHALRDMGSSLRDREMCREAGGNTVQQK